MPQLESVGVYNGCHFALKFEQGAEEGELTLDFDVKVNRVFKQIVLRVWTDGLTISEAESFLTDLSLATSESLDFVNQDSHVHPLHVWEWHKTVVQGEEFDETLYQGVADRLDIKMILKNFSLDEEDVESDRDFFNGVGKNNIVRAFSAFQNALFHEKHPYHHQVLASYRRVIQDKQPPSQLLEKQLLNCYEKNPTSFSVIAEKWEKK